MRILSGATPEPREAFEQGRASGVGAGRTPPDPGPRDVQRLLRIAILAAIGLVVALVATIITVSLRDDGPVRVVTADETGDGPDAEVTTLTDPPAAGALAEDLQGPAMFATQFAHTYLNFSDADPAKRATTLEPFLADGLDPRLGWSGQGSQAAGVLMPLHAEREAQRITVTVAALVSGTPYSRWVYLAVPVGEDEDGRLAVIATPSYVPPPPAADVDPLGLPEVDDALSAELRPLVAAAMQAYGSDDVVSISGITAPDARIPGLGGRYRMTGLAGLAVAAGDDELRSAVAEVSWDDDAIGGDLVQAYEIQLRQLDGAWLVSAIGPR